ncbi:putative damage-inducible protein DinB [Rhizobium sp. PP-WC-2G-219]|uniref:DinB family protein n=1 Tax=Rhizobium sp. PP-CC-3G-465 TaxID=2135648 RepID=UPI000D8F46D3|nr:putative damage-inducible protein DinB [Rhizobium sp. PP-WC-1G-195]TCL89681.1 putative damage-inducible protein DinB [Rhizobium sp. PP-WC-2G-219]TCP74182.1 putative damage-inducible protein DinB [Rhizobium sp. PP-CC-2G-626]TCQ14814.1 putative damage-inducible protein DinB [Rhizobium sp. PP-CC-3G-465]
MSTLLQTLYGYHAWANVDLFKKLESCDPEKHGAELQIALRLISHYYVVSRIFAGHLQGTPHGFTSDNLEETPPLNELRAAVISSDQWYLDYLGTVATTALSEAVAFTFTDGDKGYMTREEMLIHVAQHGGYHRGEVGRVLWQLPITPPWDTFAVYLHQAEPARRQQSGKQPVPA